MAASTSLVGIEDYLKMSCDPDCEYVAGVVEERPMGEYDHSTWQAILVMFFNAKSNVWGIKARPELRVQVSSDSFRVPDVSVLSREAPREQIITHPPSAVFEILSPEDTMTKMLDKLADYERMGVGGIWVIEPKKPAYYRYRQGQLTPVADFELSGTQFRVPFAEIAALID